MKVLITKTKVYFRRLDYVYILLALCVLFTSAIFRIVVPMQPSGSLVFDELYFIPQSESYIVQRYYFDIHPPLGKMLLYLGEMIVNPNAEDLINAELLANRVDNYVSPLNLAGARLFPMVLGSLVPLLVFIFAYQLVSWGKKSHGMLQKIFPFLAGMAIALENAFIVESRYALLNQMMIFFMLLSCIFAVKYYFSSSRRQKFTTFMLILLSFGAAVGIKWLALGVLTFILVLVAKKDFRDLAKLGIKRRIVAVAVNVLLLVYLVFILHLGIYAWHFDRIKNYAPAADSVTASYRQDLLDGTNKTSFWKKFVDWQRQNWDYNQNLTPLDYGKQGEIGSEWITWPIMARPINYYWRAEAGKDLRYVYLLGNPVVWGLGLIGIIMLTGLGISRIFSKNSFRKKHLLVLLLYFANWLPFGFISRVMYMYHYFPALLFSVIAFALVLHDFVVPRLREINPAKIWGMKIIYHKLKINSSMWWSVVATLIGGILLLLVMLSFYFYSPLTYMLPLNKAEFEQRILRREWNVKWLGRSQE